MTGDIHRSLHCMNPGGQASFHTVFYYLSVIDNVLTFTCARRYGVTRGRRYRLSQLTGLINRFGLDKVNELEF
jgi:hypothetical protein